MKFISALPIVLALAFPAYASGSNHVEYKAFKFNLPPSREIAESLGCIDGEVLSGGYTVDNTPEFVRAIRNMPIITGGSQLQWRVDLRNFGGSNISGQYYIIVICSGVASVNVNQQFVAKFLNSGKVYYDKYVHSALDINNDLQDVFDIFRSDPDGSNEERITTAPPNTEHDSYAAAVSPDGDMIAFSTFRHRDGTQERNNSELYVADDDGSNPIRLTTNEVNDDDPRWCTGAPLKIVWAQDGDILKMNTDGSGVESIVNTSADEYDVDCSPDGSKIAFVRQLQNGQRQLFIANSDGTNEKALGGAAFLNGNPRWSPNGLRILFDSDRGMPPTGHREVYSMDSIDMNNDGEGDNLLQLTVNSPGFGATGANWSSDGMAMFFSVDSATGSTLHTMDLSSMIVSPPLFVSPPKAFANDWY